MPKKKSETKGERGEKINKNSAVDHSHSGSSFFKRITQINANVYTFSRSFSFSRSHSCSLGYAIFKWKLLNVFVEIQLNLIYTYKLCVCVCIFNHVCTKCIIWLCLCVTFFIEWVFWCLCAICWFIALFFCPFSSYSNCVYCNWILCILNFYHTPNR